jgi:hypothetical protein
MRCQDKLRIAEKLLDFLNGNQRFFNFKFSMPELKREDTKMIEITINNEQKIKVTLTPTTAGGKTAILDGKPSWTIVNGTAAIEVSEDGLSAYLISSEIPGDTVYAVSADADLGEGVQNIADSIVLKVEGARAINLGLVIGTAEPK